MKYIDTFREGENISDIYLVKHMQNAVTKNGKAYQSLVLQDKSGNVDGKVWDPQSPGIEDYSEMDYVFITGDVTVFNGANQVNIKRLRVAREGEYNPSDYLPVSDKDIEEMYKDLLALIDSVKHEPMKKLLKSFFEDVDFKKRFCFHSAAKSVHHGFVGGLLEHTLSVARICDFYSKNYETIDRDLLLTAAICHDIGKLEEISPYPENDYTDEGQLLGHIIIGARMVEDRINAQIPDFPKKKKAELLHCILSHHGELEFGSPKKPALMEAVALSFADNTDAKMQTFKEAMKNVKSDDTSWQGFNRYIDSNIRRTEQW